MIIGSVVGKGERIGGVRRELMALDKVGTRLFLPPWAIRRYKRIAKNNSLKNKRHPFHRNSSKASNTSQ
jgi:PDZ domain-containing secreted protein